MNLISLFVLLASLFFASASRAEISIVVNPSLALQAADASDIKRVYLGKSASIGGLEVTVIDQSSGDAKTQFLSSVINKSESQYKAYWSKLLFTGKGRPPKAVSSDAEVLSNVAASSNGIGFVNSASVNDTVKVVATF